MPVIAVDWTKWVVQLKRSNSALKGVITKLKQENERLTEVVLMLHRKEVNNNDR